MLFGNAGKTIKTISSIAFCLLTILILIGAILSIMEESLLMLLVFAALFIIVALFCLFLYAFGQLVSDTYSLKQLTNISLECQIKSLSEEDQIAFYNALDKLKLDGTIDI